jgi:hypothetical protein
MAANSNYDPDEATEPMEDEGLDIDQPDDYHSMSLDELLDGGAEGEADEEGAPAQKQAKPGNADRGDGKNPEGFRTQADFDRAWGQRQAGMRKQFEREHAEELAIANAVRRRYQGKSAAEIQEAIILDQAKELAADTGYSEEEALRMVRARVEFDERANVPDGVDPKVLKRMSAQMDQYQTKYGIDLQAEIEADESLLEFVGEDGDLSGAMIEVQARRKAAEAAQPNRDAQPQRRSVPKPETSGAARSASVAKQLRDSDFARIDAAVQRGLHVRID